MTQEKDLFGSTKKSISNYWWNIPYFMASAQLLLNSLSSAISRFREEQRLPLDAETTQQKCKECQIYHTHSLTDRICFRNY